MTKFSSTNQPKKRGRPKGISETSLTAMKKAAPRIISKIIELAEQGDLQAAALIMDRIMPKLKPISSGTEAEFLEQKGEVLKRANKRSLEEEEEKHIIHTTEFNYNG